MKTIAAAILGLLIVAAAGSWAQADIPGEVVSLFQKRCAACHKGNTPPKGLSWEPGRIAETFDRTSREVPELKIIDTASPEMSYTLKKIRRGDDIKGKPMPPLKALVPDEFKVLETWILGLQKYPVSR
jgi:cytochrome c551/c552